MKRITKSRRDATLVEKNNKTQSPSPGDAILVEKINKTQSPSPGGTQHWDQRKIAIMP
ncbi:hypothetical protein [Dyadobacter sp. CY351]|uniref:hypothetical protein n=1 Tax=Dyadobacter sp. CY351 TaxID=2909337 RepID=UPI001F3058BE|nr:hypothetical protein [Dyadobacter sp. CY351]MCF2518104.1 hypothetical protein [Dyadobacter sp. CY351]